MNQREFYSLPSVIKQIDIQKKNPHGSKEHRKAFLEIREIARQFGVEKHFDNIYD